MTQGFKIKSIIQQAFWGKEDRKGSTPWTPGLCCGTPPGWMLQARWSFSASFYHCQPWNSVGWPLYLSFKTSFCYIKFIFCGISFSSDFPLPRKLNRGLFQEKWVDVGCCVFCEPLPGGRRGCFLSDKNFCSSREGSLRFFPCHVTKDGWEKQKWDAGVCVSLSCTPWALLNLPGWGRHR